MPKPTEFVKIIFESFWCSGELTLERKKALNFAKALHNSHLGFMRQVTWNGQYMGIEITEANKHMNVVFEKVLENK